MSRNTINIDDGRPLRFYRRFVLNGLAIMISDAMVMASALCVANGLLLLINEIPFSIQNGFLIIPAWAGVSLVANLLPGWGLGVVDELRRIQGALFLLFTITLVFSYFARMNLATSRIVFLFTYMMAAMFLPVARAITRGIVIRAGKWGVPVSIYGDIESVKKVIEALRAEMGLGYIPSIIFTNNASQGTVIDGVPVLGRLHNTTYRTPVAIMAMAEAPRRQLVRAIEGPLETYRRVILIPDLVEAPSLWVVPRDLQGILGLEITRNLLSPFAHTFKRFVDLFLVILTTPLWAPLMLLLYILIWLEDRKNPLFLQARLGREGVIFRTIKFRTMMPNAEQALRMALKKDAALRTEWETYYKLKKDPRITRIGKFLRRTSLDEIPQLLNVIWGDMSLVGPRPLPSYHHEDLPERVRWIRNKVRPGITGLWQVSGRSKTGSAGMERWDPYYVRNWSVWLDIVIIARTFKAVFGGHGAY